MCIYIYIYIYVYVFIINVASDDTCSVALVCKHLCICTDSACRNCLWVHCSGDGSSSPLLTLLGHTCHAPKAQLHAVSLPDPWLHIPKGERHPARKQEWQLLTFTFSCYNLKSLHMYGKRCTCGWPFPLKDYLPVFCWPSFTTKFSYYDMNAIMNVIWLSCWKRCVPLWPLVV